jgi:GTP-binding protein SAR1
MHMLKDERLAQHQPTQYPTAEVSATLPHQLSASLPPCRLVVWPVHGCTGPLTRAGGDGTWQELSIGNIKFRAHDLGGHKVARKVWKDYYAKVCVCAGWGVGRDSVCPIKHPL